jgi:hypothetical protein
MQWGSCDLASTYGPYIATVSGGVPIGLRDHRRALDLLAHAANDDARGGRDKRRHAPQRGLPVGEFLSCRFGRREAVGPDVNTSAGVFAARERLAMADRHGCRRG